MRVRRIPFLASFRQQSRFRRLSKNIRETKGTESSGDGKQEKKKSVGFFFSIRTIF